MIPSILVGVPFTAATLDWSAPRTFFCSWMTPFDLMHGALAEVE
jgi:hypothetical protein